MTGAAERLLLVANDYRGLAAHYHDQERHDLAHDCELLELALRHVVKAFSEEPCGDDDA